VIAAIRAAVLLFVILIVPRLADASCAWLLWATYSTNRTVHAIERAFETQRSCEDAIPGAVQRQVRVWRGPYKSVNVNPVDPAVVRAEGMPDSPRKQAEGDVLLIRVSCWPLGLQPKGFEGAEYPARDSR